MSPQNDLVVANASGASVRQDLNNALQALVSNSSGATAPATTYAFQFWADTTAGQLKQRNSANDAWIVVAELDGIEENLVLRNKTAEDFDNGRESIFSFEGTQSGGEVSTLSSIEGNHSGTADDEKGRLVFKTNTGSTLTTALSIDDEQHATFATSVSGTMRYETSVQVTSGTLVEFNGLPSWAKRIKLVGYGVSFDANSPSLGIRLKTASGAVASNYRGSSSAVYLEGSTYINLSFQATLAIVYGFGIASAVRDFEHTFTKLSYSSDTDVWVSTGVMGVSYAGPNSYGTVTAGGVINTLAAVTGLQVFPTVSPGDFDAGTLVVICEG